MDTSWSFFPCIFFLLLSWKGVRQCPFYMQYRTCKFGPTCKFDHPMPNLTYSPSASSLTELAGTAYPVDMAVTTTNNNNIHPKPLSNGNVDNQHQDYGDSYISSNSEESNMVSNISTTTSLEMMGHQPRRDSANSNSSSWESSAFFFMANNFHVYWAVRNLYAFELSKRHAYYCFFSFLQREKKGDTNLVFAAISPSLHLWIGNYNVFMCSHELIMTIFLCLKKQKYQVFLLNDHFHLDMNAMWTFFLWWSPSHFYF